MPEMFPAKLTIPIDSKQFEFTIHPEESKADFEEKVTKNCPGVTQFKILSDTETLGDLKRSSFSMQVNSQTYSVYPDLRSVLYHPDSHKNHKEIF